MLVLTLVGRGGHDNGKVEDLAESGVAQSLVAVQSRVEVTGDLVQALLDINNEENLDSMSALKFEAQGSRRSTYSIVLFKTLELGAWELSAKSRIWSVTSKSQDGEGRTLSELDLASEGNSREEANGQERRELHFRG